MRIIDGNLVHMARLAVYASSYTNGVAWIHTEILKDDVLKDWYAIYPERFQNKTNGVTQRRWLGLCNPQLSELISDKIGTKWVRNLDELSKLNDKIDEDLVKKFNAIKLEKKQELADYIASMMAYSSTLTSSSIFRLSVFTSIRDSSSMLSL